MENRLISSMVRSPWRTYGLAVAAPLAGLLIRMPLAGMLGSKVPYVTFFLATVVSAGYGGFGPGMVSTILGALLAVWFIVPPTHSFDLTDVSDVLALGLFLTVATVLSYLSGRLIAATQHESALRVLFQQTLSSIGDAVISVDDQHCVRLMNPVAEKLTGWSSLEANGLPVEQVLGIVREGSDAPAELPIEKIMKTGPLAGLANHTELIARSGRRIPIDYSGAPIRNEEGQVVGAVLVFRDVTEARAAQRRLEEAERRSRTILESISDGFLLLDHQWRYAKLNRAAEEILAVSAETLLGRDYWEVHPSVLGTPLEHQYRKAVAEGKPVQFENYHETWDRWFDISAYPSDEGLAVYFRDITNRKRDEAALIRLNQDLQQFTFALTHDLREPLRMVTVYVQMLERKLVGQLDEQTTGFMAQVVGGAARLSRLVDGLLQFSRLGEASATAPVLVDSQAALVHAVENLQMPIVESGAEIAYDSLPHVLAEAAPLSQIFQNLLANAVKYRKAHCPPRIRVAARRERAEVVFSVEDNGIGIAPQYHQQVFMAFKRLHGAEIAGSGIGLATCKRIVERYGGRIWVESTPGEGSVFSFTLPAPPSSSP